MNEILHYALIGLGYLGSIAVVVVTITWALRGKLDGLSAEIKVEQVKTQLEVQKVMNETSKQTIMIGNVSDNMKRLEFAHQEHEKKDDMRFSVLGELQTSQAVQAKSIQVLEQRRSGYTPPAFPPPKGQHGT